MNVGDIVRICPPFGATDGSFADIHDGETYYFTVDMNKFIGKITRIKDDYHSIKDSYLLDGCGTFYFHKSWLEPCNEAESMLEMFKEGSLGLDLSTGHETDIENVAKLFSENGIYVNEKINDKESIYQYIRDTRRQWEILLFEPAYGLNCYRGITAEKFKEKHTVISFEKLSNNKIDITENDWMTVFE